MIISLVFYGFAVYLIWNQRNRRFCTVIELSYIGMESRCFKAAIRSIRSVRRDDNQFARNVSSRYLSRCVMVETQLLTQNMHFKS